MTRRVCRRFRQLLGGSWRRGNESRSREGRNDLCVLMCRVWCMMDVDVFISYVRCYVGYRIPLYRFVGWIWEFFERNDIETSSLFVVR